MSLFKRFVRYYRPYRGIFYADMFCATVASAVELALPLIFSYLTRTVFFFDDKSGMVSILLWWAGAIFVLYLVRMLSQYFITSWGHIMGAKMEADMRRDLFAHLEKLSFSYYDNNNTGRMMSRIVSDLFDIAELAHHGPEDLFISAIKIIGSFSILFLINWQVTLVLMGVTVLLVVFSFFYNRKMRAIFLDNRAKIADVNAVVQDSLEGIRVVQSFSNEDVEREKFEEGNHQFFLSKKRNYLMMGKGSTVRDNIAYGKPDASEEEIVEAAKRANIHEFIESLPDGYDTQVGERGVQFSGGQKQRLSIARVFLKNPPILILDEATSALDNESEKIVQDSLAELSKNRTTLIIAHRLSTVRNADEILVLTEDGIAERGSHRELLEKAGLYAGLYNMQFDVDAPWKQ